MSGPPEPVVETSIQKLLAGNPDAMYREELVLLVKYLRARPRARSRRHIWIVKNEVAYEGFNIGAVVETKGQAEREMKRQKAIPHRADSFSIERFRIGWRKP